MNAAMKLISKKIELLIVYGHGASDSIALGPEDNNESIICNSSVHLIDARNLSKSCIIILQSCSTGKCEGGVQSIAEIISKRLYHTVLAPKTRVMAENFILRIPVESSRWEVDGLMQMAGEFLTSESFLNRYCHIPVAISLNTLYTIVTYMGLNFSRITDQTAIFHPVTDVD